MSHDSTLDLTDQLRFLTIDEDSRAALQEFRPVIEA